MILCGVVWCGHCEECAKWVRCNVVWWNICFAGAAWNEEMFTVFYVAILTVSAV